MKPKTQTISFNFDALGNIIVTGSHTTESVYLQFNCDKAAFAGAIGWVPCEDCHYTDGTVNCKHRLSIDMIASAIDWLDSHVDDQFADPGYFNIAS